MARIVSFLAAIILAFSTAIAVEPIRPDYVGHDKNGIVVSRLVFENAHHRVQFYYNKDGSVKTREVQEINDTGATTKRTVYKGDGTLDHTYENYYSNRNYLSRTNSFNAKGELDEVDIYFDDTDLVTILDGHGKFLRTESTYDPTLPQVTWATPYTNEFPYRSPTPKPLLQRFTEVHLNDTSK